MIFQSNHLILIFVIITILSNFIYEIQCRKNHQIIEEVENVVNKIWSSIEGNGFSEIGSKLKVIEGDVHLATQRVEKIIDWIETSKLSNRVLEDRLDRLEGRIKVIDEYLVKKVDSVVTKTEEIVQTLANWEINNDAKLRKLVNIISENYQLSKDLTISLNGRQSSDVFSADQSSRVDDVQKKLLEKLSVLEAAIQTQLSAISTTGKATLNSCDNLNAELLMIRDECQTDSKKFNIKSKDNNNNKPDDHDYDEKFYSEHANHNDKMQCSVNLSSVKHEINKSCNDIISKLENQVAQVGRKIDEYSVACRGRGINNFNIMQNTMSNHQSKEKINHNHNLKARTSINPNEKTKESQKCQHSSNSLAAKNCLELHQTGANCDGPYIIRIQPTKIHKVYCDMNDNGGGWTVS